MESREGDWLEKSRAWEGREGQEAFTSPAGPRGGQRRRGRQGWGQWELPKEPQELCPANLTLLSLCPAREPLRRRFPA